MWMNWFSNSVTAIMQYQSCLPTNNDSIFMFLGVVALHRAIVRNFIVTFQHQLRDRGIVRDIGDLGATVFAVSLILLQPSLAYRFFQLCKRTRIVQYGPSSNHFLEIITPENNNNNNNNNNSNMSSNNNVIDSNTTTVSSSASPSTLSMKGRRIILFFVHGGGWGSGQPWMYRLIAEGLGKRIGADTVINVGYPVYPQATIIQQSECIQSALHYYYFDCHLHPHPNCRDHHYCNANIDGKASDGLKEESSDIIVLSGHSSGANICAIALLKQLQNKWILPREGNSVRVDVFVGFSGVYDIVKHYPFEAQRGVHLISPMAGAAGGPPFDDSCSPTRIVSRLKKDIELTCGNKHHLSTFSTCLLLHGTSDNVVPHSSTIEFSEVMESFLPFGKVNTCFLECDHTAIVTGFMIPSSSDEICSNINCTAKISDSLKRIILEI